MFVITGTDADATNNEVTISCETCVMRQTDACQDCLVTFFCDRDDDVVVMDLSEQRAVRLLNAAGLVPRLRHDASGHLQI
jgi:hypothetical protein